MAKRTIAFVHTGSNYHLTTLADPALQAYDVADVYLPEYADNGGDFSEFDSIYIASRNHPTVMAERGALLAAALDRPDTKVFVDGVAEINAWLPGVHDEPRGCNFWGWRLGEDVGIRNCNEDHPMWRNYLSHRAMHWHYHGVLTPPAGAVPLLKLVELDEPTGPGVDPWGTSYPAIPGHDNVLAFYDNSTYAAEVIVTTLDASFHHGLGFMPGATQLMLRMLAWLNDS
ncbi:hypothetical protein [Corynebacterium cystitidis]|uniref:hypothetical protein n=1 Tax=Corynebacterium cystitidis TaxID=35757 RepID=UPI00211DC0A8|nr:hypothetical protein [Corynebacterium cystitidis]